MREREPPLLAAELGTPRDLPTFRTRVVNRYPNTESGRLAIIRKRYGKSLDYDFEGMK